jgi:hypothetical protein
MLTYEPSYYATLMLPLVVFSLYKFIFLKNYNNIIKLIMLLIPFMLTISAGVIGALVLSFIIIFIINARKLLISRRVFIAILILLTIAIIVMSFDNLLSERLNVVLSGRDSSGEVRILQSNYVAWKIAEKTNILVGSGFGQAKFLAVEFFEEFWIGGEVNRLANVVAGFFAEFGIIGLIIRFSLEIYWFIWSKTYNCQFRLTLFIFVFIYQFTGSFSINLAEYVIWIFAFIPIFPYFASNNSKNNKIILLNNLK